MSEDEISTAMLAAALSKGILSGDSAQVENLLRTTTIENMYKVNSLVTHDLSIRIDTPGLDAVMKGELKQKRDTLRTLFLELVEFIVARKKVEQMDEGHPKHVAMMNLMGLEALDEGEWLRVQVDLSDLAR